MLPSLNRFLSANDYEPCDTAGLFRWHVPTRRSPARMTYLEMTLGELALAQIDHHETEGLSGLPEVHITTDEGDVVIMVFDRRGGLMTVAKQPAVEAPAPC